MYERKLQVGTNMYTKIIQSLSTIKRHRITVCWIPFLGSLGVSHPNSKDQTTPFEPTQNSGDI